MPVLEAERVELVEGIEPASDDLRIFESVTLAGREPDEAAALVEAFVQDGDRAEVLAEAVRDGRGLVLDLIRPCVGKGKGRHLYKADMLEANAGKFTGWKMYLNHLSDQARRALGGLPRDVRDLGGIVQESWWNPDVPAEGRFGRGAVQAVVSPVPVVQELHRVDPRLVECSINATATGCTAGKVGSERVWIVEGIENKGSVDWVTDGGAGGRVAQIMEAMIEDGSAVTGMLDDLDNGTILAWLGEHRPELIEAMKKKPSGDGDGDGSDDESDDDDDALAAEVKKIKAKSPKMSDAQATAFAKQALKKKKSVSESSQEDDLPEITPEALVEAFSSDEGKAALTDVLGPVVADAVRGLNLGEQVIGLVEAKLDDDRIVIQAQAEASADRRGELRDMRDYAHEKIEESRLADSLKQRIKAQYALVEGTPTAALDLVNDEDGEGKVVKSARVKLDEALTAAIDDGLALMGELNPTRVRGQGPSKLTEGNGDGEGKKEGEGAQVDRIGPRTRGLLEAAGIKDPDQAWQGRHQLA